jgi:hypothetical protein
MKDVTFSDFGRRIEYNFIKDNVIFYKYSIEKREINKDIGMQ